VHTFVTNVLVKTWQGNEKIFSGKGKGSSKKGKLELIAVWK